MRILEDNIFVWEEAMSREWCENLTRITDEKIEIAEKTGDIVFNEGGEYNANGCYFRENDKRIDTSLLMSKFGSLHVKQEELLLSLEHCLQEMRSHYRDITRASPPAIEQCEEICCKVQRTPPGGGFCDMHYEQGGNQGESARRWGVWMLYLNDVTEGGKTDFPVQDLYVQPTAGTMVIWPAAYTHPHRSAPDLGQYKYIVTGWFQYYIEGESFHPREVSRR